ncbi:SAF domain-containing protein [Allokutzneria sp. A3M-2-11 16]|uniref:SAF domain-containing protein n=1 Tax=Allokutzneria sp. A3M-2-11 16 TaxID=2962043 RepID=UPI0020B7DD6A|nr:SAF domain-containing protein [Allokutzneria sp. A3M-2-11 16]MCP3800697.1 SAF domain-containing protein [Allokutzneria sp. A3M-2-11 16]
MSTNITTHANGESTWVSGGAKPAARSRRRSVPHLVVGVLLVLGCATGFLVVSLTADARQLVLALARPVAVGQVVTAQDLREVSLAVDTGVSFVDVRDAASVVGKRMSVNLPAGALLTAEAVRPAVVPAGQAIVAVAVKAGQVPVEVAAGAQVSVVRVPGRADTAESGPATEVSAVWPAVVVSVTSSPQEQDTVVSVQLSKAAARQVAAVPAGQVAIVLLAGGER